jgi:hypothetical protein
VDYIREINAFYDHDLVNQLSQSAGYLYLALLNMANRLFWKEGFVVSDVMLMARSGIKDRRTFNRAVKELISFNLIIAQEGRNSSAYTILGLANRFPPARNVANSAASADTKNAASNAANDVNQTGVLALNAALFAENDVDFIKNPASNAALNANYDTGQDLNYRTSSTNQTKQNKLNKTKIPSANDSADQVSVPINKSTMIADLVEYYRKVPNVAESKGDYSFIGALNNEFGYQTVLAAIQEMSLAAAGGNIQKPLPYLRAILKRASPGSGPDLPAGIDNSGEEDPIERYQRERYQG